MAGTRVRKSEAARLDKIARAPTETSRIARGLDEMQASADDLLPGERAHLTFVSDGVVHRTSSGLQIIQGRQHYFGIPVWGATRQVRFDADGRVLKVTGAPVPVGDHAVISPQTDVRKATLIAVGRQQE